MSGMIFVYLTGKAQRQRRGTLTKGSAIMFLSFTLLKCFIATINGQIISLIIGCEVTDKLSYFVRTDCLVHHLRNW